MNKEDQKQEQVQRQIDANLYRLLQARSIIRNIRRVISEQDEKGTESDDQSGS